MKLWSWLALAKNSQLMYNCRVNILSLCYKQRVYTYILLWYIHVILLCRTGLAVAKNSQTIYCYVNIVSALQANWFNIVYIAYTCV